MKQTFNGKKILITGHTGFKGSWLTLWLKLLGAQVIGYSLDPPTSPSLFDIAKVDSGIIDLRGDIRNRKQVIELLQEHQPDFVFHLAAQPIVLDSYEMPVTTFEINAMGTVNILEAIRQLPNLSACIIVTTDKCYDNQNWSWGYRESDRLGGSDPYSASKSMAEIAAASYVKSFPKIAPIATVRAGNIIGGGDFSPHRLIPDSMVALMKNQSIPLRNPMSVRPWLYILDCLYGYLTLAKKLIEEGSTFSKAWNFGPQEVKGVFAKEIVEKIIELWGSGNWNKAQNTQHKEMPTLRLNWDQAAFALSWKPQHNWESALRATVNWYQTYYNNPESIPDFCINQIRDYTQQTTKHAKQTYATTR